MIDEEASCAPVLNSREHIIGAWDKANAGAATRRTTQYFEMLGNRAIYKDDWVAATTPVTQPWMKPAPS